MYTRKDFAKELGYFLQVEGYDLEKLERWASHTFHEHIDRFEDDEIYGVFLDLMCVTMDEQCEFTEQELYDLVEKYKKDEASS